MINISELFKYKAKYSDINITCKKKTHIFQLKKSVFLEFC